MFLKTEGNATISFFFKPFHSPEKIVSNLTKPDALATHTINGIINHVPIAGIFATYAGFITTSDYNGEVIFPRKHTKPVVDIIITTEIIPVALFENTIDHWRLAKGVHAEMYRFTEHYNKETDEYFWQSERIDLPADKKIPLSAMIIIAKPNNIFIPSETAPTIKSANLVLPTLYVEKGINIVLNSTYILHIRHLFKPVDLQKKRQPLRIMTHVID
jgi:hypothetical protein